MGRTGNSCHASGKGTRGPGATHIERRNFGLQSDTQMIKVNYNCPQASGEISNEESNNASLTRSVDEIKSFRQITTGLYAHRTVVVVDPYDLNPRFVGELLSRVWGEGGVLLVSFGADKNWTG